MPDRTRNFSLPRIQDLSKEQEAALALPLEGQHLIIGGPGTGKSVVALLRAQRLARENCNYLLLVYNHLLLQANVHLFGGKHRLVRATWDRWFRQVWRRLVAGDVPTLEPNEPGGYRPIDWQAVNTGMDELPPDVSMENPPCLVIDEGQDMPPAFYHALLGLGLQNFYVVADQNQQIHPDLCSSLKELEHELGPTTLELRCNYRNTYSIARLAREFYTGDPASPPPELPPAPEPPSIDTPRLVTYGDGARWSFQLILDRILQICDRNPRKLVGILAPNNAVRKRFVEGLNEARPSLDHEKPPIRTYVSGQQVPLDFGQGGIMVINAQSCKGLEFDMVFLADIDQHRAQDEYALKSRFYVMVARARDRVILLRGTEINPRVEAILPDDLAILERR